MVSVPGQPTSVCAFVCALCTYYAIIAPYVNKHKGALGARSDDDHCASTQRRRRRLTACAHVSTAYRDVNACVWRVGTRWLRWLLQETWLSAQLQTAHNRETVLPTALNYLIYCACNNHNNHNNRIKNAVFCIRI